MSGWLSLAISEHFRDEFVIKRYTNRRYFTSAKCSTWPGGEAVWPTSMKFWQAGSSKVLVACLRKWASSTLSLPSNRRKTSKIGSPYYTPNAKPPIDLSSE